VVTSTGVRYPVPSASRLRCWRDEPNRYLCPPRDRRRPDRDQGLTHLTLHTGAYNTCARAFYAAVGFAEEEARLTRRVPPA